MHLNIVKKTSLLALMCLSVPICAQADSERSVEETRSTLVGVMEALVQKGVLTEEQAKQIVATAPVSYTHLTLPTSP
jgi:hypothetical protein